MSFRKTKQVAEEVTQAVRAMYQEGHIDKPTAEYLLPPEMVRTQEMYFLKKIHKNPPSARLGVMVQQKRSQPTWTTGFSS